MNVDRTFETSAQVAESGQPDVCALDDPRAVSKSVVALDVLASNARRGASAFDVIVAPLVVAALVRTRLAWPTAWQSKDYAQALDTFELIWAPGLDVNLLIVGGRGWLVDKLANRLLSHSRTCQRFFGLESISDEYLECTDAALTCLIAASEGQGFVLPLIEAVHQKILIIAKNLPAFKEVAGREAYYFLGVVGIFLASLVNPGPSSFEQQSHPQSDSVHG
ncbi:glycosyltransferase involved in cell wall biosynthesis [Variovorax ginsengisoli]|uniref:Glycosyltransferase involved in cell wall biosynthesis n=1 Tax=Variovorax ginsengisoli TaxID=363844 RepID=A0ABT9SB35_9BURK|nr:glycosyltransferase involved in cell wall biosynthesis [Variovorax ginsengisoli]